MNPCPLRWEHGVLATRPPGKPLLCPSDAPSTLLRGEGPCSLDPCGPHTASGEPAVMEDSAPCLGCGRSPWGELKMLPPPLSSILGPGLWPSPLPLCESLSQGLLASHTAHFSALVGARAAETCREALALPSLFYLHVWPHGSSLGPPSHWSTWQLGEAAGRCAIPLYRGGDKAQAGHVPCLTCDL